MLTGYLTCARLRRRFFTQTGWPESAPDTLERQQLVQALHSYQVTWGILLLSYEL